MPAREDTETIEALAAAVRRFVREQLVPAAPRVEEDDRIPEPLVAQLKALGLFGMTVPEEYGGLGLSMYGEARIIFKVCYASPVFRSYFRYQQWRRYPRHHRRRHRGAAAALSSPYREGRTHRLLLPHRTRRRLGCRVARDARRARGRHVRD